MNKQENEGLVIEVRGEDALVVPNALIDCGCEHGEGVRKIIIEMKNEINAVAGDRVIFEDRRNSNMLAASFIMFILPIILVFSGAIAGHYLSGSLGINASTAAAIGGVLLFIISIVIMKFYENHVSRYKGQKPVMIRKVERQQDGECSLTGSGCDKGGMF
jgi:sigma-E factor negative regulatory protein RseC